MPEDPPSRWQQVQTSLQRVPGVRLAAVPARVTAATVTQLVRARRLDDDDPLGATPTPGWIASVAVDELILGLTSGGGRLPDSEEMERVATELRVAWRMYDERGWLGEPDRYHREPAPAQPVIQHRRIFGVAYEHLRWLSGFRPYDGEPGRERWLTNENNHTAHAYVVRHPEPDRPWLLCIHGLGTGVPIADFFAFRVRELVEHLGVNVAMPVLPRHGPRKATRRIDEFLTYDLMDTVHGMTQAMWDLRALIGWIRAQGGTRIGMHGISLGGYSAGLLAALEQDLGLAIAGVPLTDVPSLYATHAPPVLREQALHAGLLGDTTDQVHRVISPLVLAPRVPYAGRAVYGGQADRMSTLAQAQRLWVHWDEPSASWYHGNHVGVAFNREVRSYVTERISSWLGGQSPARRAAAVENA